MIDRRSTYKMSKSPEGPGEPHFSLLLIMAFIQRLLLLGLLPVIALVSLQVFFPATLRDIQDVFQVWSGPTATHQLSSLPRSDTPLIMSAFTHWSHYEKIAKIAVVLAEIGYPITFVTGRLFENEVTNLHPNIKFFPLQGQADKLTEEEYKTFASLPEGSEEAALFLQKFALVNSIEPTHNTLQQVYKEFRDQHGPAKPILSFYDSVVVGHLPIMIGAPGIKPDVTWAIGLHPITLDSNDTYPFHMNKLPETGPNARELHWAAYQARHEHYRTRELDLALWAKFRDLGAVQDTFPSFLHAVASLPDHLMTMGIPEFEFARTDLRDNVHYFGGLQGKKKSVAKTTDLPPWWSDVEAAKKQGKKIVAVSQGTVDTNLNEILIPTLEALKEDENVLVIASTVAVEPEGLAELVVPGNARAAKFVPYDHLLPLVRLRSLWCVWI